MKIEITKKYENAKKILTLSVDGQDYDLFEVRLSELFEDLSNRWETEQRFCRLIDKIVLGYGDLRREVEFKHMSKVGSFAELCEAVRENLEKVYKAYESMLCESSREEVYRFKI